MVVCRRGIGGEVGIHSNLVGAKDTLAWIGSHRALWGWVPGYLAGPFLVQVAHASDTHMLDRWSTRPLPVR
jgi:hypothetical protein